MIRQIVAQLHLWMGLLLCLPLVVLGLTGSILVFKHELEAVLTPQHPPAAQGEPRTIGEILAAAQNAAPPSFRPLTYMAPPEPGGTAVVRLVPSEAARPRDERVRIDIDPVSLQTYPHPETSFLRQLSLLHSTLLLPNRNGRQLVGWLGVAMLVIVISGLVNWWPQRGRWRAGVTVVRGARGYRLHRELHGAVGFWSLSVFVVVGFAGVCLSFPQCVRSAVNFVLPAPDLRGAARAPRVEPVPGAKPLGIDAAVTLARERVPDAVLRLVFLPTPPDQPIRISLQRADNGPLGPAATVLVDPWARRVIEVLYPRALSPSERVLASQYALHAGRDFNLVWKMLVFVSGLLPLLFSVTGILMWQLRRRHRRTVPATGGSNSLADPVHTAPKAGE